MPNQQPSNAPDDLPAHERDEATPGAVLNDASLATSSGGGGGGGLGGATAADPLGGSGRASGGATPNSPIDVPVPHEGDPTREAQARSLDDGPAEPHGNTG